MLPIPIVNGVGDVDDENEHNRCDCAASREKGWTQEPQPRRPTSRSSFRIEHCFITTPSDGVGQAK